MDSPVFTQVYGHIREIEVDDNSLYITGSASEARGRHSATLRDCRRDLAFAELFEVDDGRVCMRIDGRSTVVSLRSGSGIARLLDEVKYGSIYLDITSLEHRVWAPLLRGMRRRRGECYCVYVEPADYRVSPDPTAPIASTIFDLSERIDGIAPLPGFVSFRSFPDDVLFVPILGFEGARFTFMIEAVQPDRRKIVPVIGVPGFRPEYPFYSYFGNRVPLEDTKAWQNVRFVPAHCPFSLYQLLEQVAASEASAMKIAPIGTKPHALGAVLYCLEHPKNTEIIYDHPIARHDRTEGVARTCLYDLTMLWRGI